MLKSETRESALARLGRALADPTRCRILVALLDGVSYPGQLASHLGLSRSNGRTTSPACAAAAWCWQPMRAAKSATPWPIEHLSRALAELLQVVLAVDPGPECLDAPAAMTTAEVGQ